MGAFYNEFEPYPAQWTRNLIAAGHIAPGVVDERSIHLVEASDVAAAAQAHFFSGIAAWSYALRLAGWPDDRPVWTGSCPCQPFSGAGKRAGFADARHLWPEWLRLIRGCRPPVVFGEQVASPDGLKWFDAVSTDLEAAGYAVAAADLCAAGLGAPHKRQRLFFVAYTHQKRWPGRCTRADTTRTGEAQRGGAALALAHTSDLGCREVGRDAGDGVADGSRRSAAGCGGTLALADAEDIGCGTRRPSEARDAGDQRRQVESVRLRDARRLADADRERCDGIGVLQGREGERLPEAAGCRKTDGLEHTDDHGAGRDRGGVPGEEAARQGGGLDARSVADLADFSGATRGAWAGADWVPCRDGLWRPTEPGTLPLVDGATARVGRVRAYGNAISPQVAAIFIQAVMAYLDGGA